VHEKPLFLTSNSKHESVYLLERFSEIMSKLVYLLDISERN